MGTPSRGHSLTDGDSLPGGFSRCAPSVPSHRILRHPLSRITCLRRAPPSSHGRGGPCPRSGVPIRRRCSVPGMRLWFCVTPKLLTVSQMLKSPTSFCRRRFQEATQGQSLTCHGQNGVTRNLRPGWCRCCCFGAGLGVSGTGPLHFGAGFMVNGAGLFFSGAGVRSNGAGAILGGGPVFR